MCNVAWRKGARYGFFLLVVHRRDALPLLCAASRCSHVRVHACNHMFSAPVVQVVHFYYGPWRGTRGYSQYTGTQPPKLPPTDRDAADVARKTLASVHCWALPRSAGSGVPAMSCDAPAGDAASVAAAADRAGSRAAEAPTTDAVASTPTLPRMATSVVAQTGVRLGVHESLSEPFCCLCGAGGRLLSCKGACRRCVHLCGDDVEVPVPVLSDWDTRKFYVTVL